MIGKTYPIPSITENIQKLKAMDHHLAAKQYEERADRQIRMGGALFHLAQELQDTLNSLSSITTNDSK